VRADEARNGPIESMRDLNHPAAMWTKAILFVGVGSVASVLLLLEVATLRGALLLAVSIWAFCRAYYFAFYVIGKYVDSSYRFSGLLSFLTYMVRKRRNS
jgi:hypothetical protein